MDHGLPATLPFLVIRLVLAAAGADAGIPLGERDREFADGEGLADRHLVWWLFGVVLGRAHREAAGGDHHHLGADVLAVAKDAAGTVGIGGFLALTLVLGGSFAGLIFLVQQRQPLTLLLSPFLYRIGLLQLREASLREIAEVRLT